MQDDPDYVSQWQPKTLTMNDKPTLCDVQQNMKENSQSNTALETTSIGVDISISPNPHECQRMRAM